MADPYDYYRTQPQAEQNPWMLQGSPGSFNTSDPDYWRKMRQVSGVALNGPLGSFAMGKQEGGTKAGAEQAALYALAGGPWSMALTEGQKTFGGMNEIQNGQFFQNLGQAQKWGDFASFGLTRDKRRQKEAEIARRKAIDAWRVSNESGLADKLGQYGADVRRDLGGELHKAVYTGEGDDRTRDAMTAFTQRANEYMLGRQRAGQARKVEAMFADPARADQQAKRLKADRNQGMSQLAEQYRIGQRENAFNQARRGMQGSSVDVEAQGANARGRDIGAASMQAGLDAKAQQYRLNDAKQKNTLMGMIYGDDPNMASAFHNTLQGIEQQGAMVRENQAISQQMQQQRTAAATGYSQALGGLMTSASGPLGQYVEHRGTGA